MTLSKRRRAWRWLAVGLIVLAIAYTSVYLDVVQPWPAIGSGIGGGLCGHNLGRLLTPLRPNGIRLVGDDFVTELDRRVTREGRDDQGLRWYRCPLLPSEVNALMAKEVRLVIDETPPRTAVDFKPIGFPDHDY
jgi:hypothetical protein